MHCLLYRIYFCYSVLSFKFHWGLDDNAEFLYPDFVLKQEKV